LKKAKKRTKSDQNRKKREALKKAQEKDKIGSKPDKNGKRFKEDLGFKFVSLEVIHVRDLSSVLRKFYSKPTNNNLRTSSSSQSANKKQEFVKIVIKRVEKKDKEKKRDMSRVKCNNCKKEGHFAKDCKKAKVKDYEYYKTKMLLAKKDKDEQVLLAEDQAWMESSSDSDQEINANMVFMAQIEKVISDSEASSSSADEKIFEVSYYLSESKSESEYETSEYYDNSTNYGLFVNNDDDQEIFHDANESASESFIENHIDSQKDYDKSNIYTCKLEDCIFYSNSMNKPNQQQPTTAATKTNRNKETSRKDQQEHQRQQDHGTAASGHRSIITINEFDTSLPVAVCSGLVNTSSVRRWCIDDHIVLSKLPTVNGFDLSLPRVVCSWTSQLFTHRVICMRIPLLYRGEYSQWVERFMNYLKEQTDGEAMINSIKNGDQPLPRVTQVSIASTTSTEQPPLKDKSMWSDQEKRVQKIDHLARSLLI
nr:hypothetical protein [Tanacetum cinerariifolium]